MEHIYSVLLPAGCSFTGHERVTTCPLFPGHVLARSSKLLKIPVFWLCFPISVVYSPYSLYVVALVLTSVDPTFSHSMIG